MLGINPEGGDWQEKKKNDSRKQYFMLTKNKAYKISNIGLLSCHPTALIQDLPCSSSTKHGSSFSEVLKSLLYRWLEILFLHKISCFYKSKFQSKCNSSEASLPRVLLPGSLTLLVNIRSRHSARSPLFFRGWQDLFST